MKWEIILQVRAEYHRGQHTGSSLLENAGIVQCSSVNQGPKDTSFLYPLIQPLEEFYSRSPLFPFRERTTDTQDTG